MKFNLEDSSYARLNDATGDPVVLKLKDLEAEPSEARKAEMISEIASVSNVATQIFPAAWLALPVCLRHVKSMRDESRRIHSLLRLGNILLGKQQCEVPSEFRDLFEPAVEELGELIKAEIGRGIRGPVLLKHAFVILSAWCGCDAFSLALDHWDG